MGRSPKEEVEVAAEAEAEVAVAEAEVEVEVELGAEEGLELEPDAEPAITPARR